MDRQQMIDRITEIGTCEDDAARRTLLAEFRQEAENDYNQLESLTATNQSLTADNESLRDANMKMFLAMGSPKDDKTQLEDKTGLKTDPEPEKLKFEDLFDEKGGIK